MKCLTCFDTMLGMRNRIPLPDGGWGYESDPALLMEYRA